MIRLLTFLTCLLLALPVLAQIDAPVETPAQQLSWSNYYVGTLARCSTNQGFVLGTNFAGCKWEVLQMSTNFIDWQSVQTNPFQSALSWTVTNTKPSEYFRLKGI